MFLCDEREPLTSRVIRWGVSNYPELVVSDDVRADTLIWPALQQAVDEWNYVLRRDLTGRIGARLVTEASNPDANMEFGNGISEVYFAPFPIRADGTRTLGRAAGASPGTALPTNSANFCFYEEIDIQIREGQAFTDFEWGNGSRSGTHIGLLLLHEMGHFWGLKHDAQVSRTMNAFYPFGGTIGGGYDVTPSGKDRNELWSRNIGRAGQGLDLAASNWMHSGAELPSPASDPRIAVQMRILNQDRSRAWRVQGGDTIIFPYRVHSLGIFGESGVPIRFFMSEDHNIGDADDHMFEIQTVNFGNRGQDVSGEYEFTTPNNREGRYWFGFRVDPEGNDIDPSNNWVRFQYEVKVIPNPDIAPEDSTIYCENASSDPDGDGWGWEDEQSCVVPDGGGTVTGDGCDYSAAHLNSGWGWNAAARESCPPL